MCHTLSITKANVVVEKYESCNLDLFGESGSFASLCGEQFMSLGLGDNFGTVVCRRFEIYVSLNSEILLLY